MIIAIVLLVGFILFMFIFMNDSDEKSADNTKEENTEQSNKNENSSSPTENDTDSDNKPTQTRDKDILTARDNAEKYVDMAYNYDLNTDYKENKSIFSQSMVKQLQKYDKSSDGSKYGENENINRSVSDIRIYFDSEEDFPETALYTAKVTADNSKEKNKMIRTVTGEVNFTEEKGKPKIDGSKEISSEETEE